MARLDSQFITKIVKEPNNDWLSLGITSEMLTLEVRPVFAFIKNAAKARKGKVPDRLTIQQYFPDFRFKKAPEDIEFYGGQLMRRFAGAAMRDLLGNLSDMLPEDKVEEAIKHLHEVTNKVSGGFSKIERCFVGESPAERLRNLKSMALGQYYDHSLGFNILDQDLLGAENGNFILLAGTPRAGKTWVMLKALYNLWSLEGKNILLFSLELSKELLLRRLDAIVAEVPYPRFRRGILTSAQMKKFYMRSRKNNNRKNWFEIITNQSVDPRSSHGPNRLDYVYSKIQQLKPDIVAIDGFYLMKGDGDQDWERMASLTRNYHHILQSTNVCGWATTQLTKTSDEKKPRLKDLSYSWTFAQDADIVLLMARDQDMSMNNEASLTVGKAREAEDFQHYLVLYNPGAEIEIVRDEVEIDNPLMD